MKILKKILVTLVASFITMSVVYGGYTIYAAGEHEFEKTTDESAMELYHTEMNTLFNDKFAAAVTILKEKGVLNPNGTNNGKGVYNPKLKVPAACDFAAENGAQKCKQICKDDTSNISPYCVSIQSLDTYIRYTLHLQQIQGTIDFSNLGGGAMRMTPVTDLVYRQIQKRDDEINKDIEQSRRVLEVTLAAYNEFLTAYPIHTQYSLIIKDLIKYKNKLKDIRFLIDQFPSTFTNTTSTKCS